jgi:hypothetical protein
MRKKSRGNFEIRSDLGRRSQVRPGGSVRHRVTIFNRADFDIDAGFVSRCRDGAIAYVQAGEEWNPIPARLEARELRLQRENSFEFPEDLAASNDVRAQRMSQVSITPWRRRVAPTATKEFPLGGGFVHNVTIA